MTGRRGVPEAVVAFGLYQGVSLLYFGRWVVGDIAGRYIGYWTDPAACMWFLNWWPYALAHGLNPFMSKMVWAPGGFNVAWSTSMPAAGLLAAPITHAFGAVVTYNVLCIVSPALSALGAFLLCRHLTGRFWPALAGGYVFGFSTYFLAQMEHLPLLLVFPVPVMILLCLRRVAGRMTRAGFLVALSLTIAFQYLLMKEIVATAGVVGGIAFLGAWSLVPRPARMDVVRLGLETFAALCVAAILVSPDVYYTLTTVVPGEIWSGSDYSIDLANFVVPTEVSWAGDNGWFRPISKSFTGDVSGKTGFIGWPFLVLVVLFARRREWGARLVVLVFAASCLAAMGPSLHIAGRSILPLPWALAMRLPLIDKALPDRLMMYAFLALALATAMWLAAGGRSARRWALLVAGMLVTVPNPVAGLWVSEVNTPRFITAGTFRRYLSPGDTVLVLPFANLGYQMLWQVQSGMYFRMAGGWTGMMPPEVARWPVIQTLTSAEPIWDLGEQLAAFVAAHDVKAIIVAAKREGPWPASADWTQVVSSLGIAPVETDGVFLYVMPPSLAERHRETDVYEMRRQADVAPVAALVHAARGYCEAGAPIPEISPVEIQRRGLIDFPRSAAPAVGADVHWWQRFWLGPWERSRVAIGVVSEYQSLRDVLRRYGSHAEELYFPYPRRLRLTGTRAPDRQGQLLMIFDCDGLGAAVAAQPSTDASS